MKKIVLMTIFLFSLFMLVGCGLIPEATTQTTTEAITVDTDTFIDIDTVSELQAMETTKSYRLTADINLNGIEWTPIGTFNDAFKGIFDGNGHTISHLTITNQNEDFNGLFGKLSGVVKDLTLTDVLISYETDFLTYAGVVAGYSDGDITNVNVTGDIDIVNEEANSYVGLLVGFSEGPLDEQTTTANFEPNQLANNDVAGSIIVDTSQIGFIGGLVGKSYNSQVSSNRVDVDIDITAHDYMIYTGGLIGHNYGGILIGLEEEVDDPYIYIENNAVFATFNIVLDGQDLSLGGLIGYNHYGYHRNNYAQSLVTVTGNLSSMTTINIGAYGGENWGATIENTVSVSDWSLPSMTEGELNQGLLIGANFALDMASGNYVDVADVDLESQTGVMIFDRNLIDVTFLEDTLSWGQELITKILD